MIKLGKLKVFKNPTGPADVELASAIAGDDLQVVITYIGSAEVYEARVFDSDGNHLDTIARGGREVIEDGLAQWVELARYLFPAHAKPLSGVK